jgi:hypothetical protein
MSAKCRSHAASAGISLGKVFLNGKLIIFIVVVSSRLTLFYKFKGKRTRKSERGKVCGYLIPISHSVIGQEVKVVQPMSVSLKALYTKVVVKVGCDKP